MKSVPFVHVRNVATNEHFDIPFDLYNHKKEMCKTDPDFFQWESNEIVTMREVPDSFKSVSDMTSNMYDPTFYQVEPETVEEAPTGDLEAKKARFAELKEIGWANLKAETPEETKALKDEYKALKAELEG
jgi:hypothetical protein